LREFVIAANVRLVSSFSGGIPEFDMTDFVMLLFPGAQQNLQLFE